MAENIEGSLIKNLGEAIQDQLTDDTDLIVEDTTPVTRRTKLSTFAAWIRSKLKIGDATKLETGDTDIVSAVNKLNSNWGKISNGTDLDTLTNHGFYSVQGAINNPTGSTSSWVNVVVIKTGGNANYAHQIATASETEAIYFRTRFGGTWGEWKIYDTTGKLSDLTTTDKSSVVAAVNEVNGKFVDIPSIGSNDPFETIKSYWGNLKNTSNYVTIVRTEGYNYRADIFKSNDDYGSVLLTCYGLQKPQYYTLYNGIWSSAGEL